MSEPTCKGSILLLSARQKCSQCRDEREMLSACVANGVELKEGGDG